MTRRTKAYWEDRARKAEAKVNALTYIMKFYASASSYEKSNRFSFSTIPIMRDWGGRARNVIQQIEAKEKEEKT